MEIKRGGLYFSKHGTYTYLVQVNFKRDEVFCYWDTRELGGKTGRVFKWDIILPQLHIDLYNGILKNRPVNIIDVCWRWR